MPSVGPSIGPSLPPTSQKRKHDGKCEEAEQGSDDSDTSDRHRTMNEASKRRKVAGPAMPPAPLDERPVESPNSEEHNDSSSEDDYGPRPPSGPPVSKSVSAHQLDSPDLSSKDERDPSRPQRDSWMLRPPSQNDLTSRMDPSKLRARKFNSGKGARGGGVGSSEVDHIWTETPEEKVKRLKDEMMGVAPRPTGVQAQGDASRDKDKETQRRVREHTEQHRGKSLYEQHKATSKAADDDPSKRVFDYAKDVGGGMRLGGAQKEELIKRAKDFGSKFSSGSYL